MLSETKHPTINLVEKGKRSPPAESVSRWAKALRLDQDQTDAFWLAAFNQRIRGDTRWKPYAEHIHSRINSLVTALNAAVMCGQKAGVDFPDTLIQRIEALRDPL